MKIDALHEKCHLNIFLILSIIEGFCSIWATLLIPTDSKKSLLFGLSSSRLAIILISIIGIACLVIMLFRSKNISQWCSNNFTSNRANRFLTGLGFISFFFLWVTIFINTKNLFPYEAVFIRLKPFLVWAELVLFQIIIYLKILMHSFSMDDTQFHLGKKTFAVFSIILVGSWIFITTTKIGLVQKTAFWNVPGIPLSTFQFIFILFLILLVLIYFPNRPDNKDTTFLKVIRIIIPIVIFAITVLLWGSTPMLKHFFSLQPTSPNFQPYPYSDARVHDLGAISVLKGDGIYFHGYTDKPLFMVFLAVLHLFAGNDYEALSRAQIFVLALIPVLIYLLGKKFHSPLFGIVLSIIVILQQRNSIILSYNVASANPKLLVSEELMYLGVVLVTYLFFTWIIKPEPKTILWLGGILGALSLVRMNPVFIIPAILLVMIFIFWRKPKIFFKQAILFGIGFLLVFSPWLFVGVNQEGKSWFFIKIEDVIVNRYPFSKQISEAGDVSVPVDSKLTKTGIVSVSYKINTVNEQTNQEKNTNEELIINTVPEKSDKSLAFIMVNHFLHNFSTSLLSLPDSIKIDNLFDLTQREYWKDENSWAGNIPAIQYIFIVTNLLILSLGLSQSWKRFRLAGLAPLIIFLTYDLSLSVALNSGSRYIVPINWIFFFYYFLGIIFISRKLLNYLNIKQNDTRYQVSEIVMSECSSSRKSIVTTFVSLILIAAIVPVANLAIPGFVNQDQDEINNVVNLITQSQNGNQLISGDILYPYYENDNKTITFDFLSNQTVNSYRIENDFLVDNERVLESDIPAVLCFSTVADQQQLDAIYLVEQSKPYLLWQKNR